MMQTALVSEQASSGIDALALANTVREPLLALDDRFVVRFVNRAFCRHFSLSREDTIERELFELGAGQWNNERLRQLLEDVLQRHRRFDDFELEHTFGALGRRILSLNAAEIVAPDASRRWILLAMEDVTARRDAEAELDARARELERFTMVASHDLQEPLRKIRAYAGLLEAECGATLSGQSLEYVTRLASAAKRMQTLIDDLLVLAKATSADPQFAQVDLNAIVRDVLIDLDVVVRDAGAEMHVGAMPTVLADSLQMRQLFQNLLSNAVKFRRPGTTLDLRIEATRVTTPFEAHQITVRDNGIGFNQEYAERIFVAFERLNGRREYTGSGIGLAICRRIVERHHGKIAACGAPAGGAVFTITLPIAAALPAGAVGHHSPSQT